MKHHILKIALYFLVSVFCLACNQKYNATNNTKWVGTWTTALQLVEKHNNPPSPGLSNNSLRQIVHVSVGGNELRLRLSNKFSHQAISINSVNIAVSTGGSNIDTTSTKTLQFNKQTSLQMAGGESATSDPIQFHLVPLSNVAITINFNNTPTDITGHPGSRTTSYLLGGNSIAKANFNPSVQTDHWYIINTLEVLAPPTTNAVAILGNSITDGRGSGTNKQNRWPDEFARRLNAYAPTKNVAVLNAGIGGNCVLGKCLGPSGIERFNSDIIQQNGIKWAIVFEGINDIGYGQPGVGEQLIKAYKQMISIAHTNNIKIYGATLLPVKGSGHYSKVKDAERQAVNHWIRTSKAYDGVIDLDKALRNPNDTLSLLPIADDGDHLHPSELGHQMIAAAINLSLFTN